MMMNPFYDFLFYSPLFTPIDSRPPLLYDLMDSMVNYDKPNKVPVNQLAKNARHIIFDFDYPLTSNINREEFEELILDHFAMRRIGYQTFTAFQRELKVKLKIMMPMYNKMFDAIKDWEIFNSGEKFTRDMTDNRTSNQDSTNTNTLDNTSTTSANDTSDNRHSNTPQNEIQDVKDGKYVTDYSYNTNESKGNDTSSSKGTANSNLSGTDNSIIHEETNRSPSDKIAILKEVQTNISNIYDLIFKDLENLFFQVEEI